MQNLFKYRFSLLMILIIFSGCSGEKGTGDTGILVSTSWLQEQMDDPDLVILHSGSPELYDSIHIPGARLIIPSHFTVNAGTVRNELPSADSLLTLLRKVGVNSDSRIVLYHETARLLTYTSRVFVTLDHLGLGEQIFLLNGGLAAWQEEELELTNKVPEVAPGNLALTELKELVIQSAELDEKRWNEDWVVIDTRSDQEYYGSREDGDDAPEGGHIEGAYFLPYQDLLLDDKPYMFKPVNEMEELFRKAGMDREKQTVVYCGSGIRACASFLAARHLGYPVLLYDGSYGEWRDLDLPLTGPVPLLNSNE
jgi:thiosulfate/3-mercaptopyruvate sulfurtransferase